MHDKIFCLYKFILFNQMGCLVDKEGRKDYMINEDIDDDEDINKFIKIIEEERLDELEVLGEGSFKTFYKFNDKAFTIMEKGIINTIYTELSTLKSKYILLPSNEKKINDYYNLYQFDVCQGDLFIDNETILNYIRNNISEYSIQFDGLIKVVESIHKLNIHTLDIKPENMLLCKDTIKLTDFDGAIIDGVGKGAWTDKYKGDFRYSDQDNDLHALYSSIIVILYDDVWMSSKDLDGSRYKPTRENIKDARKNIKKKSSGERKSYALLMIYEIDKIYKKYYKLNFDFS